MKPSWIEQSRAELTNFDRGVLIDRDASQYKHALVWYCTELYHTVQGRATRYYRIRGIHYVSLQNACGQTWGVLQALLAEVCVCATVFVQKDVKGTRAKYSTDSA